MLQSILTGSNLTADMLDTFKFEGHDDKALTTSSLVSLSDANSVSSLISNWAKFLEQQNAETGSDTSDIAPTFSATSLDELAVELTELLDVQNNTQETSPEANASFSSNGSETLVTVSADNAPDEETPNYHGRVCGCPACHGDSQNEPQNSGEGGSNGGPQLSTPSYITDLDSGSAWTGTITYSFGASSQNQNNAGQGATSITTMSAQQQAGIVSALNHFEEIANVTFQLASTPNDADMKFYQADLPSGIAGWAWYPSETWGSDVLIDNAYTDFSEGGFGRLLVVHEIGHAMGLSHPGDVGTNPSYDIDGTIMSYNNGTYAKEYNATAPQGMQIYDIATLQSIYGANTDFNSGNTTYTFNASNTHTETIWDGGGTDVIDASASSTGITIDLRESLSNVSDMGNTTLWMAFGANIENAIGGSGNDTLYGNDLANTLEGGEGDDTLWGNGETDSASYDGSYSDFSFNFASPTSIQVIDNNASDGDEGSDWLHNIEKLIFAGLEYTYDGSQLIVSGMETVSGATSSDDNLYGNANPNQINGLGGVDRLFGGDGGDSLNGGDGDDGVLGQAGDDTLHGGAGNDKVLGDTGADILRGEAGADSLLGGDGNDTLIGGLDNSNDGRDSLYGGDGNDQLWGGYDNDILRGDAGNDTIEGISGDDWMYGGAGTDSLLGGAGNDRGYGGDDADTLYGDAGADTLWGDAGNDLILGGNDADSLLGGADDDTISGGSGDDWLFGQAGDDSVTGDNGVDIVKGQGGADTLEGGAGDDWMYGGTENDRMLGDADNDRLWGEAGNDTLEGGIGNDTMDGGDDDDSLLGGAGIDSIVGGLGNDVLSGEGDKDILRGGAGNDTISGGDSNDWLHGNNNDDLLTGGAARDYLWGGSGADTFDYNAISDSAAGTYDIIYDFNRGEGDKIDLSDIGSLSFLGFSSYTGAGNEIQYKTQGSHTLIRIDTDGDSGHDMIILLSGTSLALQASDFVL